MVLSIGSQKVQGGAIAFGERMITPSNSSPALRAGARFHGASTLPNGVNVVVGALIPMASQTTHARANIRLHGEDDLQDLVFVIQDLC